MQFFDYWCQVSGGSWATVLSKVTSYCWSVLASILTIFYFLGHMELITWHSDLWFQMWLGNLTGRLSENVIVFPLYLPRFYGGVKIKTFRKNRYPNLLSYLGLLWLSSLPRLFGCQMRNLFHCFPYISSFSCTCVGPFRSQGHLSPGSWSHPGSLCPLWLSCSLFSPSTPVFHLHDCLLIPSSYLAEYYVENWVI